MTKAQEDKLIEAKIVKMMKEHPSDVIIYMLAQMGKMAVETNAASIDLKTEATFSGKRHEVKAVIKVKPIALTKPLKK